MPPPVIGMLAWEGGKYSLPQLEMIPGNIVHPETFSFPIMLTRVEGANYRTVVERPNKEVLARMIEAAQALVDAGVKAITTSCGFNIIFQKELANAVAVPVFSSSLLQVPLIHQSLGKGQQIGIITADSTRLTKEHLEFAGIKSSIPVCIQGMERAEEFSKARTGSGAKVSTAKFIQDVVDIARDLQRENTALGAIVLECTDLSPASTAIRKTSGLPVFDITTLINMVYNSVAGSGWGCQEGA